MNLRAIAIIVMMSASVSCTSKPLASEVIGLPETAIIDHEVKFKVRVKNVSRKTQLLPTPYEVELTAAADYIPGAPSGVLLSELMAANGTFSGDYAIVSNSINICPPQFDQLAPGEHREYNLKWLPEDKDAVEGALRIVMTYGFPEIPLQPITVKSNDAQQDGGGKGE